MVGYWSKVVHAVIIKQHQTFAEYLQTFDDGHGRTPLTDSQNPANSSSALSSSLWSARSTSTNTVNELPLVHIVYPLLLTPLCLLPPTSPLRPTNSFHII